MHNKNWRIPDDYCLLSKMNTLNGHEQASKHLYIFPKGKSLGKSMGFHMVGLKYMVHVNTPLWLGGSWVVECTKNQALS